MNWVRSMMRMPCSGPVFALMHGIRAPVTIAWPRNVAANAATASTETKVHMQLHQSSWPEIEAYLKRSNGIIVPIGSTEQHGPNGLLGTDAICPEVIAKHAGDDSGILIGPTFNVGSAQHHLGFSGTITLRPSTMIAAMIDWTSSLHAPRLRADLLVQRPRRQYRADQFGVRRDLFGIQLSDAPVRTGGR